MVKTCFLPVFLLAAIGGYAFEPLPEEYLVRVGRPDAETEAVEHFSLSCPTCLRLIQNDFEEVFRRYIQGGDVLWTFHPDPQDLTTLRFMVCLEGIPPSKRFSFLWEAVHVVAPGKDKENCLRLQALSEHYHNPTPSLANLNALEQSKAAHHAFSYLKQQDIPPKIPALFRNGKLVVGFPNLKRITEVFP